MTRCARGFDELLRPCRRLVILGPQTEESREGGDGGGNVEVATVSGPTEGVAKFGQFAREPAVGLALLGAVPQGEDVVFAAGEIAGVRITDFVCRAGGDELLLGELADRLQ